MIKSYQGSGTQYSFRTYQKLSGIDRNQASTQQLQLSPNVSTQTKIRYYDQKLRQISNDMDSNRISMNDVNAKNSLEKIRAGDHTVTSRKRNNLVLSLDSINLPQIKTQRNNGRHNFKQELFKAYIDRYHDQQSRDEPAKPSPLINHVAQNKKLAPKFGVIKDLKLFMTNQKKDELRQKL